MVTCACAATVLSDRGLEVEGGAADVLCATCGTAAVVRSALTSGATDARHPLSHRKSNCQPSSVFRQALQLLKLDAGIKTALRRC